MNLEGGVIMFWLIVKLVVLVALVVLLVCLFRRDHKKREN